ncbi:bifunctional DNA primase/polymerase [Streptomyces sp. NPDC101150]|uniref:bifunctional DNA primase/polymerase n=1 Tax=Streptomyces sp. NPDC101150 TaxID=3366114 RepID=UPI0037FA8685
MTNLVGEALNCAQRGWYIFPLPPGEKFDKRLRWSHAATNDITQIARWWAARPASNIGIACKPSGLLVVDCDLKDDGDGWDQYTQLVSRYAGHDSWKAFETYTVRTGGGGAHLYYRWPPHMQASQGSISTHVDIRSNGGQRGGYVLAAGSGTDKGRYEVENPVPIIDAPPWLVELVREKPPPPRPPRPPVRPPGEAAWHGLVTTVSTAPEGNRNNALLWAARSMVSDGAPESTVLDVLLSPATASGLGEREVRQTIRSACRLQQLKEGP